MTAIVTRMERRKDNSACVAYVSVALPARGIEVNGVRIISRADGSTYAQLPQQRAYNGQWFPTVRLIDAKDDAAIKAAALEAFGRSAG